MYVTCHNMGPTLRNVRLTIKLNGKLKTEQISIFQLKSITYRLSFTYSAILSKSIFNPPPRLALRVPKTVNVTNL